MTGSYATVRIVGLEKALRDLSPEQLGPGLRRGLLAVGQDVATEAKSYVKPHHYTGRAEQQIHAEPGLGTGLDASVFVGAPGGLVPELRPLMFGWPGGQGKRPPTAAIAAWLTSKPEIAGSSSISRSSSGFIQRSGTKASIASSSSIKGRAFVIARAIGKRGYTFGSGAGGQHTKNFQDAWEAVRGSAAHTIMRYLRP